ncbi:hypothetical protein C0583_00575 [Candidatus Parcubacteria bacterium]|nr:MAG: hypothetical protein C0583_00575 [Candidatus Parcubacteria bacterium]
MKKKITVNDKMQKGYIYYLTEIKGKNFHSSFKPDLNPREMLALGVFGGVYMRDCQDEFPDTWWQEAKLAKDKADKMINFFKVNASQDIKEWRKNNWIHPDDPRGWFQWYARYYMGRRHEDDLRQIKRWRAFRRHLSAVKKNCLVGDWNCRPRQRQALLHWAYDSRKI